jgi:hypothetical protein
MRWVLVLLTVMLGLSIVSSIYNYIPGQEDNPSLAKARLCTGAKNTFQILIKDQGEAGLVTHTEVSSKRIYTMNVDETLWAEEPIELKEGLAIAAWCQVAGDDGRAVAKIIGEQTRKELASVIEGEFAVSEKTLK